MKKTIKRTMVERALAGIMAILMIITMCPESIATALAAPALTYKVSGTVKYNEQGVKNITVKAQRKDSTDAALTANSVEGGVYEITGLKNNSQYLVSIESETYQGNTATIEVKDANVTGCDLTLSPKGSTEDIVLDQTISWGDMAESINCFGYLNVSVKDAKTEVDYTVTRNGTDCTLDTSIVSMQGNTFQFKKAGTYKIVAQAKAGVSDGQKYKASEPIGHTLTVNRIDRNITLTGEAKPTSATFPGDGTIELSAKVNDGNAYNIQYRMKDIDNNAGKAGIRDGKVYPNVAGEMIAQAFIPADDSYNETVSNDIMFTIDKAQNQFAKSEDAEIKTKLIYGETYKLPWKTLTGIEYSVSAGSEKYITVDQDGNVNVISGDKTGVVTAGVILTAKKNDNYIDVEDDEELNISDGKMTVSFEIDRATSAVQITNGNEAKDYEEGLTYKFEAAVDPSAAASASELELSFIIKSDENGIAASTNTLGEYKFTGEGTIKVQAVLKARDLVEDQETDKGNDHYKYAESNIVTFTVNSLENSISFGEEAKKTITVGTAESYAGLELSDKGKGDGTITYWVDPEDNPNNVITVDPESGSISVHGVPHADEEGFIGTFTIHATKESDGIYDPAEATYELTLRYSTTTDKLYDVIPVEGSIANEWYCCELVRIMPKNGYGLEHNYPMYNLLEIYPENENSIDVFQDEEHQIFRRQDDIYGTNDCIYIWPDGMHTVEFVIAVGEDRYHYTLPVNKDNQAPRIKSIDIGSKVLWNDCVPAWSDKNITFVQGNANDSEPILVNYSDNVSNTGYPQMQYCFDTESEEIQDDATFWSSRSGGEWKDEMRFSCPPESHFILYVRVKDAAGHMAYAHTNLIAYDTAAPTVTGSITGYDGSLAVSEENHPTFTTDVQLNLNAFDSSSKLKRVTASVKYRDMESKDYTNGPVLFVYENTIDAGADNPFYHMLSASLPQEYRTLTFDTTNYNYNDIIVTVTATDYSGKNTTEQFNFGIDKTEPKVEFSFLGNPENGTPNSPDGIEYYKQPLTLQIVINGKYFAIWRKNFNITINGFKINGKYLTNYYTDKDNRGFHVVDLKTANHGEHYKDNAWEWNGHYSKATLTCQIVFTKDQTYDVEIEYEDAYGRPGFVNSKTRKLPTFVIDTEGPSATIEYVNSKNDSLDPPVSSDKLIKYNDGEEVEYKVFRNAATYFSVTASDTLTPVQKVYYLKVTGEASKTPLTKADLASIPDSGSADVQHWIELDGTGDPENRTWKSTSKVSASGNQKFVIYVKAVDNSGNVSYFSNYGAVNDVNPVDIDVELDRDSNAFSYYNNDVVLTTTITDKTVSESMSGVAKVEYAVAKDLSAEEIESILTAIAAKDGNLDIQIKGELKTNKNRLTQYEVRNYDEKFIAERTDTFTVDAMKNNSDHVYVFVRAADHAGNITVYNNNYITIHDKVTDAEGPMKFSVTAPKLEIKYKETAVRTEKDDEKHNREYYGVQHTAYVYVTGRETVFYPEELVKGIKVEAWDSKGREEGNIENPVIVTKDLGSVPEEPGKETSPDEAVHKFEIVFTTDANYDFTISYKDKADNKCTFDNVTYDGKELKDAPDGVRYFTVDTEAPEGSVTVEGYTWTDVLNVITFGLWNKDVSKVFISAAAEDAISPVDVAYYKTADVTALDVDALDEIADWKEYKEDKNIEVTDYERFVIYLKITDYAGNVRYVNSDGYIVDSRKTKQENIKITLSPAAVAAKPGSESEPGALPIYNDDLTALIEVNEQQDPDDGNYSGIKKVEYWIVDNEDDDRYPKPKDQETTVLYSFEYQRDGVVKDENGNIVSKEADKNGGTIVIKERICDEEGNGEIQERTISGAHPEQSELRMTFENTIKIVAAEHNCSDVTLHVRVTDNAGNICEQTVKMDIDVTKPKIEVTFDNNDVHKVVPKNVSDYDLVRGYFPQNRTATIVITERTNHFDPAEASKYIELVAKNANGDNIVKYLDENNKEHDYDLNALKDSSKWITVEKKDANGVPVPDEDTHKLVIPFVVDANYDFELSYRDIALNDNDGVTYRAEVATEECTTPKHFTIDKVAPTGEITADVDSGKEGGRYKHTWTELIKTLTFGIWSDKGIAITADSKDETSPMEDLTYYLTDAELALTEEELLKLVNDDAAKDDATKKNWKKFEEFELEPNMQGTVYLCIIDYAGNVTFISTNAMILDNTHADVTALAPSISVSAGATGGIFNGDVPITVSVTDPKNGGAFSGLKEVRYSVSNMGNTTQEGTLYSTEFSAKNGIDNATAEDPEKTSKLLTYEELLKTQGYRGGFTVSSKNNNSNDVRINVYAEDNAGNTYSRSETIKIDVSEPVIRVTYDNNDGDVTFADGMTDAYFNNVRTATINIAERNFEASRVTVNVINSDGVIPALSGWTTIPGPGNGDGTQHVATITYAADGDYQFEITCSDMATNKDKGTDYASSLAPQKFTIDRTVPVINVTYDNNSAQNGNYYKDMRTATVTIDEHNFETSRIRVMMTANNDGNAVPLPAVSNWTNNGDRHVALITFRDDAQYTLDVDYEDKARNASADMEMQRFYVDTVLPELKIEGIADESANSTSGNIGFLITATDVNFDSFEPVLKAVVREGNGFATKTLTVGSFENVKNGKTFRVENLEEDGIYRITCTLADKAGNEYDQVILTKKGGSEYVEGRKAGDALVTFSVNREGSAYELDESTKALTEKYYVRNVSNDVRVIEINADPLKSRKVTVNGRELTEGTDYEVTESGGSGKWYRYEYALKKSLFEGEGEYVVVCSSKDKADNDAFNDVKGVNAKFVVDRTPPVVAVTGLSDSGRYQTENQRVTIVPTDDGGALKSVTVSLVGRDGSVIKDLLKLEGEALETLLEQNGGMLNFEVPEGLYQNVKIVAKDMAGDDEEEANTYDQTIAGVSVTPSGFLIFWANRPLRYGVIGGIGALAALMVFLLVWKRKKGRR